MASQNKETQSEIAQWLGVPSKWINKFTIVTTLFIVWMVFFDQHNIFQLCDYGGSGNESLKFYLEG